MSKRLLIVALALVASGAVSGCAGFWHAMENSGSTEDIYCKPKRVGYTVTDGKRTDVYRQNCPDWLDNALETRERAKARGWREDD